jgi:hypothetical protein
MNWRFSVPAGGVEGSKLCLFSVIMPAKCVSRVSPRFHYRRLAFCFLPLTAILESPQEFLEEAISQQRSEEQVEVTAGRRNGNKVINI